MAVRTFIFDSHPRAQREEVLASRQRRREQLEKMLGELSQQVEDHKSGRRLLDAEEKTMLDKKIDIFQRKLETMQGDLDDREIERILKREEIQKERVQERLEKRERHNARHLHRISEEL